jgi:hypothetical protein
MTRNRSRSLKGPILLSWVLIWLGTILVANSSRVFVQAGIAMWLVGILLQYGMGYIWFIGRPSSGATADPLPRRAAARVYPEADRPVPR